MTPMDVVSPHTLSAPARTPPAQQRYFIETMGCQMNLADSEEIARLLSARGWVPAVSPEDAECLVLNTCTVRQHAEDKALSYIGRLGAWKEKAQRRWLVVAGCAAERFGERLKNRFPQVDVVFGAKAMEQLAAQAQTWGFDATEETRQAFAVDSEETSPSTLHGRVTIMRGCNFSCSYCIVPAVRGREKYRPLGDVLSDIAARLAEGAREVILLGQTVNSYEAPPPEAGKTFDDLIEAAVQLPGLRRLRYMSPHPFYVSERGARAFADFPVLSPHLHLPAQSGSNRMLKKMCRNYTRESYLKAVDRLRHFQPDISLTTDIIVGFPGETQEDFDDTMSLMKAAAFNGAYLFKYSPRPGTASAEWADDVPVGEKENRLARLLELNDAQARSALSRWVGRRVEVVVEEVADGGHSGFGHTPHNQSVRWTSSGPMALGDFVYVAVDSLEGRTLRGTAVGP